MEDNLAPYNDKFVFYKLTNFTGKGGVDNEYELNLKEMYEGNSNTEIIYYDTVLIKDEDFSNEFIFIKVINKEERIKKYIYQKKTSAMMLNEWQKHVIFKEFIMGKDGYTRYLYFCLKIEKDSVLSTV